MKITVRYRNLTKKYEPLEVLEVEHNNWPLKSKYIHTYNKLYRHFIKITAGVMTHKNQLIRKNMSLEFLLENLESAG